MELIRLTEENLASEHICCAISNNTDCQVASKKAWLRERFADGLVFLKGDVRGKCFIEYIPAENAWLPVDAPDYMVIDCLWVSGQFKGQGFSNLLLQSCMDDSKAKGKKGLAILSSTKKQPFLADPKYLRHKGFVLADTALPQYELMALPFAPENALPTFKPCVKQRGAMGEGFTLYYTDQCPYTAKYVPLLVQKAEEMGAKLDAIHLTSAKAAQSAPAPFTAFSLFYQGEFFTNEILSVAKFEKLIAQKTANSGTSEK